MSDELPHVARTVVALQKLKLLRSQLLATFGPVKGRKQALRYLVHVPDALAQRRHPDLQDVVLRLPIDFAALVVHSVGREWLFDDNL